MEKQVMAYDLESIKNAFASVKKLRVTSTALKDARSMGFTKQDMVNVIQQLKRKDFIKSMTTY